MSQEERRIRTSLRFIVLMAGIFLGAVMYEVLTEISMKSIIIPSFVAACTLTITMIGLLIWRSR